ncbi:L-ribulose-5-phosphate 4-epimerase AraD [Mollicutes bacterium LVI A0039]|nr:L-ribulose-5-phosphate 4-epimerase AraD [Mollicutes bacterium LVI A0039]
MYEKIKAEVLAANLKLVDYGLVIFTWGNVSFYDRQAKVIAIKPSGVEYAAMQASDIVIVDLAGQVIEGELKPSSDLDTHLEIYRNFPKVNAVCHTHSKYATSFAQANRDIECLGTTHADYFFGPIKCTRKLTNVEIAGQYELNTGKVITETFQGNQLDIISCPAVLVANHGPFTVGTTVGGCVDNAKYLEEVAEMAINTYAIHPQASPAPTSLQDKHYYRKHGEGAYYGQGTTQG